MTRWALAALATAVAAVFVVGTIRRSLGCPPRPPSLLLSVVASWLGAYVLWTFAGDLAVRAGLLGRYDGAFFAVIAFVGGIWQYRTQRRQGRERGLAVLVAGQLLWLAIVLFRNGVLVL